MGHKLCGNVLYIFEDKEMQNDVERRKNVHKSIEDAFKGEVRYTAIKDVLTPQSDCICGGPIQNGLNGKTGTLGIFGKLVESTQESKLMVALSSGHVISKNTVANVPSLGRVGECIWPEDSSENVLDVSVIIIDQSQIENLLYRFNEEITVAEIKKEDLGYLPVFKYGATTGETHGHVGVVDNFRLYGDDIMTILPRADCPRKVFSEKGDSGAIVLTRINRKFHAVGVVYGGDLKLPGFNNIREETIAVFLRRALDRFSEAKRQTILLDKI